jgi:hypothetical protein
MCGILTLEFNGNYLDNHINEQVKNYFAFDFVLLQVITRV